MSLALTARADEGEQAMKWKDMTGAERYRVVEMAQKGERPLVEICRAFEVSRQTLYKAMEQVSQAAVKALEPQSPGRKSKSQEQLQIGELLKKTTGLEKKVNHWKMRYEVAQAFIDLSREAEQKEARSRKKKKKRRRPANEISHSRPAEKLAPLDDGQNTWDSDPKPGAMDEPA